MDPGRVGRLVKILTTLQSAKGRNCTQLAEILGTTRRTIFRDLKKLKDIGVPCKYDLKSSCYSVEPEFFLQPLDLTLQEALSVLLLVHKARDHIQLPFKNEALIAALKIENNLPVQIKKYCRTALQNISAKATAQASKHQAGLDQSFLLLTQAIRDKHKVNILYNSLFDKKNVDLDLSPYHLFYNHRAWYVLGHSSLHRSIRTFKLNRIEKLIVLKKRFLDGDNFDLYDYLSRAWSMIPEGRIYNVKLRFLPKVAQNVTEVHWHNTQQVTRNKDGSAIVEFRVDGIGEIFWWILGYGDQVQVLAPKELRKRIIQTAENTIKSNKLITLEKIE
jgi:predicted DNA-binding transcriptional regulator YafY